MARQSLPSRRAQHGRPAPALEAIAVAHSCKKISGSVGKSSTRFRSAAGAVSASGSIPAHGKSANRPPGLPSPDEPHQAASTWPSRANSSSRARRSHPARGVPARNPFSGVSKTSGRSCWRGESKFWAQGSKSTPGGKLPPLWTNAHVLIVAMVARIGWFACARKRKACARGAKPVNKQPQHSSSVAKQRAL